MGNLRDIISMVFFQAINDSFTLGRDTCACGRGDCVYNTIPSLLTRGFSTDFNSMFVFVHGGQQLDPPLVWSPMLQLALVQEGKTFTELQYECHKTHSRARLLKRVVKASSSTVHYGRHTVCANLSSICI